MDGARSGFPREPPTVPAQLQPVGKVIRLLPGPDELDDGEELLEPVVLLLLLEDQHEVVPETGLHHDPIDGPRKGYVRCEEHDVFTCAKRTFFIASRQSSWNEKAQGNRQKVNPSTDRTKRFTAPDLRRIGDYYLVMWLWTCAALAGVASPVPGPLATAK